MISSPVASKWNSHQMMIEALIALRAPLEALKGHQAGWEMVPNHNQYELLEKMLGILSSFRKSSEDLSSEKSIKIHCALIHINYVEKKIKQAKDNQKIESPFTEWLDVLQDEFVRQFPNHGLDNKQYAIAHLLDPLFSGAFLKKSLNKEKTNNLRDELVSDIIFYHESTDQYKIKVDRLNKVVDNGVLVKKQTLNTNFH